MTNPSSNQKAQPHATGSPVPLEAMEPVIRRTYRRAQFSFGASVVAATVVLLVVLMYRGNASGDAQATGLPAQPWLVYFPTLGFANTLFLSRQAVKGYETNGADKTAKILRAFKRVNICFLALQIAVSIWLLEGNPA